MIRFVVGVATGILLLEGALALESPRPTTAPIPPIHTYNIQLPDGTQTALLGTHIVSTGGPCVEVWLSGRIDTIVCGVRFITEKIEGPEMPEAAPPEENPSLEARR